MLGNHRTRRGNYSMLSALMILIMVGFGAISVDVSLVRLGASQAQDVADAASQGAIVMYRQARIDGLTDAAARAEGEEAARYLAARNAVVGGQATVQSVAWGIWDINAAPGSEFTPTASGGGTTAAQVNLDRAGSDAIGLTFGRILGRMSIPVRGNATSATRNIQVVMALDITGSWDKDEFYFAREAALAFFDILAANHGPDDRIGVEVWFANYAFEYVPMMTIDDAIANPALARDLLATLNVGNYSGLPESGWAPPGSTTYHVACKAYGTGGLGSGATSSGIWLSGSGYYNGLRNVWSNASANPASGVAGRGCHPSMPRYFQAEGGTDHHTGLMLARTMIRDQKVYRPGTGWVTEVDPLAYRAVVVLTDGLASAISPPSALRTGVSGTGNTSTAAVPAATSWSFADANHPEPWQGTAGIALRAYRRDTAHSFAQIRSETPLLAANMNSVDNANI